MESERQVRAEIVISVSEKTERCRSATELELRLHSNSAEACRRHRLLGVRQELLSSVCQGQRTRRSMKERGPQLILKSPNQVRDRGLTHFQFLSRSRERPVLRGGNESE